MQKLVESLLKDESNIEGKGGGLSYSVRKWARSQGKTTGLCLQTGTYKTGTSLASKLKFHAAEALVFSKLRKQLGLHKVHACNQSHIQYHIPYYLLMELITCLISDKLTLMTSEIPRTTIIWYGLYCLFLTSPGLQLSSQQT